MHPHGKVIALPAPVPGCVPEQVATQAQAWAWFQREQACALAAQRAAADRREHLAAWLLMRSLYPFHHLTADMRNHVEACRTALNAALSQNDPTLQCDAHRFLGEALCGIGRHDEGMEHLHTALTTARHLDDRSYLSATHHAFALAWEHQGRHDEALRSATRFLRLAALSGNPVLEARARSQAGRNAARLGRHDLAVAHCRAALPVHREYHDRDGEANSLFTLGLTALDTGDAQQAATHFQAALTLFRTQANTSMQADTLDRFAEALHAGGDREQAGDLWHDAAVLYHQQGRHDDATRVQRRLNGLSRFHGVPLTESAR
ncbi:tetratricopeptide repeat protein [Saccharothrix texasensis]|uniref:Tetratricopeptide repeat protein n=2 Tax=Saccharothrix texasensis TaxID=103734 RepID=A0A3N1HH77_9PSEU|nr:tetratricopeptide repeat protein [Saccharothrix texasensis]